MKNTVQLFHCTQPCANCPYRTDAPLKLWHKSEFKKLLDKEHDYLGAIYYCHKKNGSACVGWMIKQYEANFPSIYLRIALSKHNVPEIYFSSLSSPVPLFDNVTAMIKANYPELLKEKPTKMKELTKIVTQFRKGILGKRKTGPKKMCFVVCAPLQGFLHGCGYFTTLVQGDIIIDGEVHEHWWLSYKDLIIDPTASQFLKPDGTEMPEVYIGEKPDWYQISK